MYQLIDWRTIVLCARAIFPDCFVNLFTKLKEEADSYGTHSARRYAVNLVSWTFEPDSTKLKKLGFWADVLHKQDMPTTYKSSYFAQSEALRDKLRRLLDEFAVHRGPTNADRTAVLEVATCEDFVRWYQNSQLDAAERARARFMGPVRDVSPEPHPAQQRRAELEHSEMQQLMNDLSEPGLAQPKQAVKRERPKPADADPISEEDSDGERDTKKRKRVVRKQATPNVPSELCQIPAASTKLKSKITAWRAMRALDGFKVVFDNGTTLFTKFKNPLANQRVLHQLEAFELTKSRRVFVQDPASSKGIGMELVLVPDLKVSLGLR